MTKKEIRNEIRNYTIKVIVMVLASLIVSLAIFLNCDTILGMMLFVIMLIIVCATMFENAVVLETLATEEEEH